MTGFYLLLLSGAERRVLKAAMELAEDGGYPHHMPREAKAFRSAMDKLAGAKNLKSGPARKQVAGAMTERE